MLLKKKINKIKYKALLNQTHNLSNQTHNLSNQTHNLNNKIYFLNKNNRWNKD